MIFSKKCFIVALYLFSEGTMRNSFFIFFSFLFIFFNILTFNIEANAKIQTNATTSTQNEQFEAWKRDFRKIAIKKGIDSALLDRILPQITYLPRVIDSDKKQSEFLLTFWTYTNRVISDKRIQSGKLMLKKHQELVQRTSEKYGIQPEFLIAFWGLETNYGSFKGETNTLNALATLAFDKRRRAFFTNELITLLKMIEKGEQTAFKGSWAGAFGNFQFMPTTYAAYAVDADGDGKKDIINSLPDAFESAANYLSKMGWNDHQSWGTEVFITKKLDWQKIHANKSLPISEWARMGIVRADQKDWPNDLKPVKARLVLPTGVEGPAFLAYRNFDLIMRWNNSTLYALSVGILADKIKYNNAPIYAKPQQTVISRSDLKEIQTYLKEKGFYKNAIDGILGKGTRTAIQNYQKSIGWDEDGYPSLKLLSQLRKGKIND